MTPEEMQQLFGALSTEVNPLNLVDRPPTIPSSSCQLCEQELGFGRYLYSCASCGASFCNQHLPYRDFVNDYDHTQRVCLECHRNIQRKAYLRRVAWRLFKVKIFFDCNAQSSFPDGDSNLDKARRGLVAAAAPSTQGGTYQALISGAAQGVEFLRRHGGLTGEGLLMSPQFSEAAATLRAMGGQEMDVSMLDFVVGMYYLAAFRRLEVGQDPEKIKRYFEGCAQVPDSVILDLLTYAQLGARFPYITVEEDLRRVLELQGYELLFSKLESVANQPAYYLAANRTTKTVFLGIRGTQSLDDVLTDMAASPVKWPPQDYDKCRHGASPHSPFETQEAGTQFVHGGLGQAALWMFDEFVFTLQEFQDKGYNVIISGHSLAAGVAALLTVLLRPFVTARCYSFATPCCVGPVIAQSCEDYVTTVSLSDDVIPRASMTSSQALVLELSQARPMLQKAWEEEVASVLNPTTARLVPAPLGSLRVSGQAADSLSEGNPDLKTKPPENDWTHSMTQLTVPGKRIHIYFWRGVPEAVFVPIGRLLNKVELSPEMITHHKSTSYVEALQDVARARKAEYIPPPWSPFEMESRCACCRRDFTWAAAFNSTTQQALNRHHCHRCGSVVCQACSNQQAPIPLFGIHHPVRVCDKCFHRPDLFDDPNFRADTRSLL